MPSILEQVASDPGMAKEFCFLSNLSRRVWLIITVACERALEFFTGQLRAFISSPLAQNKQDRLLAGAYGSL